MGAVGQADISKLANALNQAAKQSGVTTQQVLISSSNELLADMQSRVPVKTGKLRTSLGIQVEGDKVTIGPNLNIAPYANYVEFGTKPHEIRPKPGNKVLVFQVNGRRVFTRLVHHPGTKPQPYVQPAFEEWVDSLGTMAAEANVKVIKANAP
jgi:HK97 gp10 family phage protein